MQQQQQQQQKTIPQSANTQFNGGFKSILNIIINSSITVKAFCVLLIIGYLFQSINKNASVYLCVIPGKLLPPSFWLWTLVTHTFIEYELFQVFIDMFVVLLYSKMVEPLWGTKECLIFYFIITTIVALCTTFIYFIVFSFTTQEAYIFNTNIHGLSALIGGFCVAIKQLMPDTLLLNVGIVRIKQDDLPMIYLLWTIFFYLVNLVDFVFLSMSFFGIYVSWLYLRFFQKHNNGNKGDTSTTFSFASFFPTIIQPFVAILSNTLFNILVMIKICKQPPKRYNVGAPSQLTISLTNTPGIDTADAERRRQKALKALKERLNKTDNESQEWHENSDKQQNQELQSPDISINIPQVQDQKPNEVNSNEQQQQLNTNSVAINVQNSN